MVTLTMCGLASVGLYLKTEASNRVWFSTPSSTSNFAATLALPTMLFGDCGCGRWYCVLGGAAARNTKTHCRPALTRLSVNIQAVRPNLGT